MNKFLGFVKVIFARSFCEDSTRFIAVYISSCVNGLCNSACIENLYPLIQIYLDISAFTECFG